MEPRVSATKEEVERLVLSLSSLAKQECPDAVVEVHRGGYTDEVARITVRPPNTWSWADRDRLEELLAQRSLDLLIESGLLITIGVAEGPAVPA